MLNANQRIRSYGMDMGSDLKERIKSELRYDIPGDVLKQVLDRKPVNLSKFKITSNVPESSEISEPRLVPELTLICPICFYKKERSDVKLCSSCHEYLVQLKSKVLGNIAYEVKQIKTMFELSTFGKRVIGFLSGEDVEEAKKLKVTKKSIQEVLDDKLSLHKLIETHKEENRNLMLRLVANEADMKCFRVPFENSEPREYDGFNKINERSRAFFGYDRFLRKCRNIFNTNYAFKKLREGKNLDKLLCECIRCDVKGLQQTLIDRLKYSKNYSIIWLRAAQNWIIPKKEDYNLTVHDLKEHFQPSTN